MIGASLRDRPPLEGASDRHEGRVEDRDREHQQRQHDACQRRPGRCPAGGERERGEPETDHLAAGVAHEDNGLAAGSQVEGEEADARAAERERDDDRELARVPRDRIHGEHGAGDRRERRGQPIHVVEQVERVRDPDQPDDAEDGGEQVRVDDLDGQPRSEDDSCGGELRRELRDRGEREEVVDETGDEEHGATSEDPRELAACVGAEQDRRADACHQPEEDPDSPEHGRRALVPALPGRSRDEPVANTRAQQTREDQSGNRERCDRGDRIHERTG